MQLAAHETWYVTRTWLKVHVVCSDAPRRRGSVRKEGGQCVSPGCVSQVGRAQVGLFDDMEIY